METTGNKKIIAAKADGHTGIQKDAKSKRLPLITSTYLPGLLNLGEEKLKDLEKQAERKIRGNT